MRRTTPLYNLRKESPFLNEYHDLQTTKTISHKSRLFSLTPFLDKNDIIRVGGRLRHSPYGFEKRHPAVLCSKHPITHLIFRHHHHRLLHCGPQALLATVRETFWSIGGRNLAELKGLGQQGYMPHFHKNRVKSIYIYSQHFWSRWAKEYVSQLQQRVKWKQNKSSLCVGSLVLILR
ncbi:hypothetical protein NQ317_015322 [Molorchus minor]|uniref:DUF5641 domain-containing protein n=1 Tax=Molorchus minor TaxID=1323400 RepID=A0ABQ9JDK3_9CUCU|nr:hypothetical protein NQ317_015322 [Molorchus minor]